MEFEKVLSERFSCKRFDASRQVEKEKLMSVLEAGRLAPTAKNLQEHHVYVLRTREDLALIDQLTPCRYGAPTVLVVTYDTHNVFTYPGGKMHSGIEDAVIVATHMVLEATNVGLDSCWLNYFDPDKLARALHLPQAEEVVMLLDLGYRADGVEPLANHSSRKPLSETATFRN